MREIHPANLRSRTVARAVRRIVSWHTAILRYAAPSYGCRLTDEASSPFSAGASVLGAVYQIRVALLHALDRLRTEGTVRILVEALDDIEVHSPSQGSRVLQTKHHGDAELRLGDASPDLWKSLRIWSVAIQSGRAGSTATYCLLTTATAADGSIAARLRSGAGRDVPTALRDLESTARSSQNKQTEAARLAFTSLSPAQRSLAVHTFVVADGAPGILRLDVELAGHLRFVVDPRHLTGFLDRLEGWWYRRVVSHLVDGSTTPIEGADIEDQITDLREQFKRDNLPIDVPDWPIPIDALGFAGRTFVRQLHLLGIGNARVVTAIRDYLRAYEQRARWVREELVYAPELERYERRLIEEWQLHFEAMKESMGPKAAEEECLRQGRALYKWAEQEAQIWIRPACREPFLMRGSYHKLSDETHVGWHPEFRDRLRAVLDSSQEHA